MGSELATFAHSRNCIRRNPAAAQCIRNFAIFAIIQFPTKDLSEPPDRSTFEMHKLLGPIGSTALASFPLQLPSQQMWRVRHNLLDGKRNLGRKTPTRPNNKRILRQHVASCATVIRDSVRQLKGSNYTTCRLRLDPNYRQLLPFIRERMHLADLDSQALLRLQQNVSRRNSFTELHTLRSAVTCQ
jgi:hypothetical protein